MGLNVGNLPVTAVYVGSTPVTAVYVGAEKIWPTTREVVQITLGTGNQAADQFLAALTERGLNPQTVTEIPFDIELVGGGSTRNMFYSCYALTSVPEMDTSQVTDMSAMFYDCTSLTTVPDMDTSQVTGMSYMFGECISLTSVPEMDTSQVTDMSYMFGFCMALTSVPDMDTSSVTNVSWMFDGCAALTDGNVRLIGRHPNVNTAGMIEASGLTREPFFDAAGNPIVPEEVHQVSLTNVSGMGTVHPLVSVTVPAGQVWDVQIEGTVTRASSVANNRPAFRIGSSTSGRFAQGASVDFSGTVSSTNATIAMVANAYTGSSFTGTVTIRK